MGKPLMIQAEDDRRIETLKQKIGAPSKVEVVRIGLALLEAETARKERISRWKKAAGLVAKQSAEINEEFRKSSRMKKAE